MTPSAPTHAARRSRFFLIPVLLCMTSGCATYLVSSNTENDDGNPPRRTTMHSFFWGLSNSPRVEEVPCDGAGLQEVKVVDNFGYDLLGVVTLGIWKPIRVEVRCRA